MIGRFIHRTAFWTAGILLSIQTFIIGLDIILPSTWTGPFDEIISWVINAMMVGLVAVLQRRSGPVVS